MIWCRSDIHFAVDWTVKIKTQSTAESRSRFFWWFDGLPVVLMYSSRLIRRSTVIFKNRQDRPRPVKSEDNIKVNQYNSNQLLIKVWVIVHWRTSIWSCKGIVKVEWYHFQKQIGTSGTVSMKQLKKRFKSASVQYNINMFNTKTQSKHETRISLKSTIACLKKKKQPQNNPNGRSTFKLQSN